MRCAAFFREGLGSQHKRGYRSIQNKNTGKIAVHSPFVKREGAVFFYVRPLSAVPERRILPVFPLSRTK